MNVERWQSSSANAAQAAAEFDAIVAAPEPVTWPSAVQAARACRKPGATKHAARIAECDPTQSCESAQCCG
jgi:hypothetical protein